MPATLHAPLLLLGLFWVSFVVKFYRSSRAGKIATPYARSLWLSYFLGGLVVTFSGKEIDRSLDHITGDVPITFYTKFVCALLIIHTLYFMLRPTMVVTPRLDRILRYGCLLTILIGLVSVPVFITLTPSSKEQLRYGLLAFRDIVVSIYMVMAFIPTTYMTWRQEAIEPMKLKHFVGLMFDLSYLLLALGNGLTFLGSFWGLETAAFIDLAFKPVLSLCILFFMISALPHQVLAQLFWPQRWWVFYRLRRLEAKIASLIACPVQDEDKTDLEGRIYRTVIFILDHYSILQSGSQQTLYHKIAGVVSIYPDYSQLIEHLAKLP